MWSVHFFHHQPQPEPGPSWDSPVLNWSLSCINIKLASDTKKCHLISTGCDYKHLFFSLVGTPWMRHSIRYVRVMMLKDIKKNVSLIQAIKNFRPVVRIHILCLLLLLSALNLCMLCARLREM